MEARPGTTETGTGAPGPLTYAVVLEWTGTNYSAYVPDLPGCISTGTTPEETVANIREAIELHLEGMAEDNEPIPPPQARVALVAVAPAGMAAPLPEAGTPGGTLALAGGSEDVTGGQAPDPGEHELGPGAYASVQRVAGWRDRAT